MLGLFYKSNSFEAKLSCCVLIVKITLNVSVPYILYTYIYIYVYIKRHEYIYQCVGLTQC